LDTSTIEVDYGLFQIVTTPTHNQNLIDKVVINQPDLFDVYCFKSLIKTEHLVVLLTPQANGARNCNYKRHSRSQRYYRYVTLYDLLSHHLDKLRYAFGNIDWSPILCAHDIDVLYETFLSIARYFMA